MVLEMARENLPAMLRLACGGDEGRIWTQKGPIWAPTAGSRGGGSGGVVRRDFLPSIWFSLVPLHHFVLLGPIVGSRSAAGVLAWR